MKRLLILRLSALGDVIHTIPAVVSLKGSAKISWVVEAPYQELVEVVAGVETIPVRMKNWTREPRAALEALRKMRGFDASIDFQGLIKSAMLGALGGARTRYGFDRNAIREKPALLFTNRKVNVDTTRHVIEQNLELARAAAGPPVIPSVVEGPGRVGRQERASRATPPGPSTHARDHSPEVHWDAFPRGDGLGGFERSIVLLPGAGQADKVWPVDRFRELAKQIGPQALAVWGPGERVLAEAIGAPVAPPTNLRELAWLLQKAEVVIGVDTGPLHLAAALGTKVIGLYGPTDPHRNGPYGQLERCIDRFRTTKSMESISVEEVMKTLQTVVGE